MEKTSKSAIKTIKALETVYIFDGCTYFSSVLPRTESTPPLTPKNFRLIADNNYLTVNDIHWAEEDGNDRNFCYKNGWIDRDIVPAEVRSLLDTVIATQFSIHHPGNVRIQC